MKFDAQNYPYASKRSVVYAKNGMVCVGNPTAASAGLQTLLKGGNAIDAAITVATCQPVVEPTGNGLGSDCFALIWYKGKLYGINGSGPAPMAASIAALTFWIVLVSDLGIMRDTLYLGVPPLMDLGSHAFT